MSNLSANLCNYSAIAASSVIALILFYSLIILGNMIQIGKTVIMLQTNSFNIDFKISPFYIFRENVQVNVKSSGDRAEPASHLMTF